jgi:hypothetical protein
MHGTLSLLHPLQLTVDVCPEDAEAAKAKGYKGAIVDIDYHTVPRTGDFFNVDNAVDFLEVTRVTHWGPGFDEPWTEIHFSAPLKVIDTLLALKNENVEEKWEPAEI